MTDSQLEFPGPLEELRVSDLQTLAAALGVKGAARMRKSLLIDAIEQARRSQGAASPQTAVDAEQDGAAEAATERAAAAKSTRSRRVSTSGATTAVAGTPAAGTPAAGTPAAGKGAQGTPAQEAAASEAKLASDATLAGGQDADTDASAAGTARAAQPEAQTEARDPRQRQRRVRTDATDRGEHPARDAKADAAGDADTGKSPQPAEPKPTETAKPTEGMPMTLDDIVLPPAREGTEPGQDQDDAQGDLHRKRSRSRNRNRPSDEKPRPGQGTQETPKPQPSENVDRNKRKRREDVDPEIAPDDVLLPIAGILDVLDNYAFVRTSSYLAGSNDVYVSLGQVRKYGLRKGDAIVGAIRQPREGEYQSGRQKYNALVKIDSVNGETADPAKERPEFDKLTALYPQERITLETTSENVAERLIDLFAPIGKGSRGLVIAPPKSGKSIVLERIANAIATNSPDTHLMLVLVDERPEEVTRLERTIHGEVIASTFDMPSENHTTIAELAIERAKRLVELGLDVVVLLDSITHLARAYNLTAPSNGRIIAGEVDAHALHPAKRFFGAARNVENGGSLTILATAMVETGSRTDEVILEELTGTNNMELRLSREIANKRIFPAVDIASSSTLHEDQLLRPDEIEATWAIRRALDGNAQAGLEAVLERMSRSATNADFLSAVRARPINPAGAR